MNQTNNNNNNNWIMMPAGAAIVGVGAFAYAPSLKSDEKFNNNNFSFLL